ncbi:hypothetical protein GCM10010211_00420 [Streptomyces albospinus]|uniref:Helix-turn-helix domain-containing protein n=1 Tax=Streptomyces albospinus TaxID=285515 RepID=A0ABQ2ULG4_9ACTN|nr:hypothetical protein GCM10010211_00420 [Streptomyces albospinus]
MRIQRTPRRAHFTIVGNDVLRNRELSFTARGILGYLLSLPDGADEDVRKLADKNPKIGRKGIRDAVDELISKGYYFRHTYRDDRGRVRTDTYVFDTPQETFLPTPAMPGTGAPTPGSAGSLPSGVKDLVSKNEDKTPPASPDAEPEGAPADRGEGDAQHTREAARLLARLGSVDSRLKLTAKQTTALAPLAAEWLSRGATIAEITDATTQGLPQRVYSAAKLVADRLQRKMPEPRRQWKTYADCADGCGRLLPAGQDSGICAVCAGIVPPPLFTELVRDAELDGDLLSHVTGAGAELIAAIRARKAARA